MECVSAEDSVAAAFDWSSAAVFLSGEDVPEFEVFADAVPEDDGNGFEIGFHPLLPCFEVEELEASKVFDFLELGLEVGLVEEVYEMLDLDLPAIIVPGVLPEGEGPREDSQGPSGGRVQMGHDFLRIAHPLQIAHSRVVEIGVTSLLVELLVILVGLVVLQPVNLVIVTKGNDSITYLLPLNGCSCEFI
jgi:hypothetical protein